MLLCFGVTVLLCHTEVDYVDDICGLGARSSDQKVVRLNVSVNQITLVDCLDAGKLL
jgi:hypothetical protein